MTENQAEPNVSGLMHAPEAVVWRVMQAVMLKRRDPDTGPSHVAARRDAALRFLASPDFGAITLPRRHLDATRFEPRRSGEDGTPGGPRIPNGKVPADPLGHQKVLKSRGA